jgi:microcompartment protein CcmK/EutM
VILGRVVGNAVSTVQHPVYEGQTVLVIQPVTTDCHTPLGREFLACDAAHAGVGDLVMCAREGNTARQILGGPDDPFHAVVVGIVDHVDLAGS